MRGQLQPGRSTLEFRREGQGNAAQTKAKGGSVKGGLWFDAGGRRILGWWGVLGHRGGAMLNPNSGMRIASLVFYGELFFCPS